jgi:hypothetical protein
MVPTMLALQEVALDFLPSAEFSVPRIPPVQCTRGDTNISPSSVRNQDPNPDPTGSICFWTSRSGSGFISQRYGSGSGSESGSGSFNKQKYFLLKFFFVGILKLNDENSRIRIQALVRGMVPRIQIRIRIHTNISGRLASSETNSTMHPDDLH